MLRAEILAGYLQVLDDINGAIRTGLNALEHNAATTRMIIDELMNGAEPVPTGRPSTEQLNFLLEYDTPHDEEDIEEIANQMVEQILGNNREADENKVYAISVGIDPDKVDPEALMQLVEQKMNERTQDAKQQTPKKEEILDDEFDFDNPFE